MWVVQGGGVQDVAPQEAHAQLPARDVRVVLRVVVKQRSQVHLEEKSEFFLKKMIGSIDEQSILKIRS